MSPRISSHSVATPVTPATPAAPALSATPEAPRPGWLRMAARREALPEAQLSHVRLDVVHAYGVAHATYRRVLPLRAAMCAAAPFAIAHFDDLPDLASALYYANGSLQTRDAQLATLPTLLEELTPLRTAFTAYLTSLVASKQLDTDVLTRLQGANNYVSMVPDLDSLTRCLLDHADVLAGKSPFSRELVEHAAAQTRAMALAVALRTGGDSGVDALTLDRDRAVTLLVHSYDQVRRVVSFLRWDEGDVATLVPALNPQGARGAKASDAAPETPAAPAAPAAPVKPETNSTFEALTRGPSTLTIPPLSDPFTR